MKWPLAKYKETPEKPEKINQTKNPWLLESVENGLKATNIKDMSDGVRINRKVPIQYFEYARVFGKGAFETPLKVLEMFGELRFITPKTKGFIFGMHKYLYHGKGILRKHIESKTESFFSNETLRNQSAACYLNLVTFEDEGKIKSMINELEHATTS